MFQKNISKNQIREEFQNISEQIKNKDDIPTRLQLLAIASSLGIAGDDLIHTDEKKEFISQVLNYETYPFKSGNIDRDSTIRSILVSYLQRFGFQKIYQGSQDEGYQSLLLNKKDKVVLSVEILPGTGRTVIRSRDNQLRSFATKDVLNQMMSDNPDFSSYRTKDVQDLPLVSLKESLTLPYLQPMHDRIDKLSGAAEATASTFFATGCIQGYSKEFVRELEEQYLADERIYLEKKAVIQKEKLNFFSPYLKRYYQSQLQSFDSENNNTLQKK